MPTYRLRSTIPSATAEQLFDWHACPGAFQRLNPPWDPITVVSRSGPGLEVGTRLELEAAVGPATVRWFAEHTACERPSGFTDEQRRGPFRRWVHQHRFADANEGAVLEDEIDWAAPLGPLGAVVGGVPGRLERVFPFRHRRTADDLARHATWRDRPRMRVLVSGATGLIGSALCAFLDAGGHEVVPIVRQAARGPEGPEGVVADFGSGTLDPAALEGFDAVVHLAGAPIGDGPWTRARKQILRDSRVNGTATVARALAACDPARRPGVFVSGSAVGYYGDAGDAVCTEEAPAGETFLAEIGKAWEAAAEPAVAAGVRTVFLRTGLVLAAGGGLLDSLLPMYRAGLGGPIGSGRQFMPWIHLDDELGLIHEALFDERYEGPLNATAPTPVRNQAFAKALGRAVSRPAIVPGPAAAVRLALGREKADELALQGQRAVPARAQELGFRFLHEDLEAALRFELGVA